MKDLLQGMQNNTQIELCFVIPDINIQKNGNSIKLTDVFTEQNYVTKNSIIFTDWNQTYWI